MKVTQKIAQCEKENKTWWSFEYFPPRTAQVSLSLFLCRVCIHLTSIQKGLQNLLDRIERMRGLGPEFIDITW